MMKEVVSDVQESLGKIKNSAGHVKSLVYTM